LLGGKRPWNPGVAVATTSWRANGSCRCARDDGLREVIQNAANKIGFANAPRDNAMWNLQD
jgi:hypothetical protein